MVILVMILGLSEDRTHSNGAELVTGGSPVTGSALGNLTGGRMAAGSPGRGEESDDVWCTR